MKSRDVTVLLTRSGRGETLYAVAPIREEKFKVLRCRHRMDEPERRFPLEIVGPARAVIEARGRIDPDRTLCCGSGMFVEVGGVEELGRGFRLAAGGEKGIAHLVSSSIRECHRVEADRSWVVEPILRAYRNGDRHWRDLLSGAELPYELGDEGIQDDETGSLAANALERFYQRRLEVKAERRDETARFLGHELVPRSRVVSNDELGSVLRQVGGGVAGSGDASLAARQRCGAGLDAMLATVLAADRELPARVVVVPGAGLAEALVDAAGAGMAQVDPMEIQDRRVAGRIAAGLDGMLRAIKAWSDEIPRVEVAA